MGKNHGQIIPLRQKAACKAGPATEQPDRQDPLAHSLDLLMEDFGKRHVKENCALCEPMKILGRHRDEVMVELGEALFLAFFPSFEGYLAEVRDGLLQGLLNRQGKAYDSWQEKVRELLCLQVQSDADDFVSDIQRHLLKFSGVELEPERRASILAGIMARLEEKWWWKGR